MPIQIIRWPDPILNRNSEPYQESEFGEELQTLADNMLSLMKESNGMGLAAPQIGVSKQIIVYKDPDTNEEGSLCNIEIEELSEERDTKVEGCLSVPYLTIPIERPTSIQIKARRPDGSWVIETVTGTKARIIQHETDHLNGLMFFDNLSKVARSMAIHKYLNIMKKQSRGR